MANVMSDLTREAELIIGEELLTELKEWYLYTLGGKWDYVVFIVRRSYIVSLIMEEITGRRMEDEEHTSFVTDSAFLLCCEDLATFYNKYGFFPSILLCDDVLIHGRNINRVIRSVEDRLCELMPNISSNTIRAALAEAIKIHVHTMADVKARLWLNERYWVRLEYRRRTEQFAWRKMASNISTLIFRSRCANATYICSEFITVDQFDKINLADYYKSIYQNSIEYTKVSFSCIGESVRAIYTLRLIEDKYKSGYRVIPFVFLPNLDEKETQRLLNKIYLKARDLHYDSSFIESLEYLNGIEGKRSINEWITLLLSIVVLQEFNHLNAIAIKNQDMEEEISKLARNYRMSDLENTKRCLRHCVENPLYRRGKEMEDELFTDEVFGREIVKIHHNDSANVSPQMIREKMDDYFYDEGKREEQIAVEYRGGLDVSSCVRGSCFVLKDILSNLSLKNAKIAVAYLLQMTDAGVISLSSFAPVNMKVLGFSQFAKAGEQSLLVKPLRYIEYIPCLALIYEWCEQVEKDFSEYFKNYMQSEYCDIDISMQDELIELIEDLKTMNQTPNDWNANYMVKFDIDEEKNRFKEIIKLSHNRSKHVESYKLYNETHRKIQ